VPGLARALNVRPDRVAEDRGVKLAARCHRGRIAFVRPYSFVSGSITRARIRAGRRSLRASR
jgi:hypothetical protein